MKMKLLAGALAALFLTGPVQAAEEFSDANAVSQRLRFIAGAVEFGFNLTALPVNAYTGGQGQIRDLSVATFEVTSSDPRQLAIGWDTKDGNVQLNHTPNLATIFPSRGGQPQGQVFAFYGSQNPNFINVDGYTMEVTRTQEKRLAGNVALNNSNQFDGTYRLSMVAAVYNP